MDDAFWVVALEGEGAGGNFAAGRVGVIDVLRLGMPLDETVKDK